MHVERALEGGRFALVQHGGQLVTRDHASAGAGLRNMRDRVAAAGGALSIRSGPEGTTVVAAVPAGPA